MTDYLRLLLVFFAAVNPAAIAVSARGLRLTPAQAASAGAIAGLVLVVLAFAADTLLDALDVAPESFRIAAGIVMAVAGVAAVWWGGVRAEGEGWGAALSPLAIPLLLGPAALVAAISYGADEGAGQTLAAALPIVAVGAAIAARPPRSGAAPLKAAARLTGALLVVLAIGLIVDGVRAV